MLKMGTVVLASSADSNAPARSSLVCKSQEPSTELRPERNTYKLSYGSHKNNASLVLRKRDDCVPSHQEESNRGLSSTTWGSSNLLP